MGIKKERKHINLVGARSVGTKTAKAGSRAKRLKGGRKSTFRPTPGRGGK